MIGKFDVSSLWQDLGFGACFFCNAWQSALQASLEEPILSLPKSIERGVLYTWQLWQVFYDPSTSTSRLLFLMDVSIYYKSDL